MRVGDEAGVFRHVRGYGAGSARRVEDRCVGLDGIDAAATNASMAGGRLRIEHCTAGCRRIGEAQGVHAPGSLDVGDLAGDTCGSDLPSSW
jgi:hypothetical protein